MARASVVSTALTSTTVARPAVADATDVPHGAQVPPRLPAAADPRHGAVPEPAAEDGNDGGSDEGRAWRRLHGVGPHHPGRDRRQHAVDQGVGDDRPGHVGQVLRTRDPRHLTSAGVGEQPGTSSSPSGTSPSGHPPSSSGHVVGVEPRPTATRAAASGPVSAVCGASAHEPSVTMSESAMPISATSPAARRTARDPCTDRSRDRCEPALVGRAAGRAAPRARGHRRHRRKTSDSGRRRRARRPRVPLTGQPPRSSRISAAVALGVLPTRTPAASSASALAAAVPDEPETIAPAWPMVLPSGAVKPAT